MTSQGSEALDDFIEQKNELFDLELLENKIFRDDARNPPPSPIIYSTTRTCDLCAKCSQGNFFKGVVYPEYLYCEDCHATEIEHWKSELCKRLECEDDLEESLIQDMQETEAFSFVFGLFELDEE